MPGVDIQSVPKRFYTDDINVHLIGYLREPSASDQEAARKEGYSYRPGDLAGKKGLEFVWEKYLRGERGSSYIQVDAFGRKIQSSVYDVDLSLPEIKEKSEQIYI